MRLFALAGLLIASGCLAQEPPAGQRAEPQAQKQDLATAPETHIVTIPAGTKIRVALDTPLTNKTTRPGDAVRVKTAFPVTVETQLAIPSDTYIEGVVDKVARRRSASHGVLQMHFTRIVFANGYAVNLNDATAEAKKNDENDDPPPAPLASPSVRHGTFAGAMGFQQQLPPLPPLPRVGPSIGTAVGIGAGVAAVGIVALILVAHHRGGYVSLEAGSQIDMLLQSPLSVDTIRAVSP